MERCVQDVKKQGRTKEQAIRICFNSVVRGKDMSNARVKRKKSQRADLVALENIRKEARKLADEPLADLEAENLSEAEAQEALEAIAEETYSEDGKEFATKPREARSFAKAE